MCSIKIRLLIRLFLLVSCFEKKARGMTISDNLNAAETLDSILIRNTLRMWIMC